MRVAVASQFYAPIRFGGAELSTQLLCEALVRRGHDVHVLTTLLPGLAERENVNGVEVRRVPCANIYTWDGKNRSPLKTGIWHGLDIWNPVMLARARAWLKKIQADILHTNAIAGISVSVWQAGTSLGIPVVHTIRDYYLLCPKSSMFRNGEDCLHPCFACAVYSKPKQWVSDAVKCVVGISRFVLERHLKAGVFTNVSIRKVIHNIVAGPALLPSPEPVDLSRPLRVGFIGRLHPSKGVEVILEAVSVMRDEPIMVNIAGSGDSTYEAALKAAWEGSRVQFFGRVDPPNFFREIDVLVVPSLWHEPLGRVVGEAYAHGVPVIASDRGGLPEIVQDGVAGFIFDPSDSRTLESVLRKLLSDKSLLSSLRAGARSRARDFTGEAIVAQYEEVYGKLALM
jgi:glycosyltransferase involved in cell wall biosynthesis